MAMDKAQEKLGTPNVQRLQWIQVSRVRSVFRNEEIDPFYRMSMVNSLCDIRGNLNHMTRILGLNKMLARTVAAAQMESELHILLHS